MKKLPFKSTSIVSIILLLTLLVWKNLPLSIRKYSEIKYGNQLVENLRNYQILNSKLPNNEDWPTLDKLDFERTELATNPIYQKVNAKEFKLIFVQGFDGPYLTYYSKTNEWGFE
jgi:hypothetical protein